MSATARTTRYSVPKFAAISCASAGNNEIVAAIAGTVIRVVRFTISSNGTNVNGKFRSASTDLMGAMALANGLGGTEAPMGHFETVAGEALNLNLSAAVAVTGYLTYLTYE